MIKLILIWNIAVMLIYGFDKLRARNHAWRIPEKVLITSALFGGGIGAFVGMKLFRHKTKHITFKLLVPFSLVLTIVILAVIYMFKA